MKSLKYDFKKRKLGRKLEHIKLQAVTSLLAKNYNIIIKSQLYRIITVCKHEF